MQFSDFPLDHRILSALTAKGFDTATEIQAKALPHALLGKDLLASSKTGSGKTLAFLLPAVHRVLRTKALSKKDPRVLILAPTRELAKQVFMQLKWLTANMSLHSALILGGENFNDQVKALRRGPQFIVGTAGRVADHLKDRSLFLNGLELLIFDEADRMLDLGFASELKAIDRAADHRKRQTMMFSATLDSAELHYMTREMLNAPQRISVGQANEEHLDIEQRFFFADHIEHKDAMLSAVISEAENKQVIVFTATRSDTERLAKLLEEKNVSSTALSAELNQSQRSNIMNAFSRGQYQVLVTTDVASRGLDLLNVALVINFDLPKMADEYVHRIGRTGRAGQKGKALSFVGPKDWNSFKHVKRFLTQSIEAETLEGFEATFKGYKDKPKKKSNPWKSAAGTNADKPSASQAKPKAKRIKHMEGVDVGDAPLKRKPRKTQDVNDDESAESQENE
ncbi:DEAD/DEAH box helicase [Aestuariibacter sp. AA17]|uniref:DEAD/DEAH box helicase n=1 Tax=Fluctibacter corallii TaxID=2984329 RepID=A0ABT3A9A8_9ALTE|nr:DEAD/DEAH box helicase [Aestuariibacter sp. AA17]MCV2885265.1 DEAD/DEAH box helicase [Aestuariibacter sp. AA17]